MAEAIAITGIGQISALGPDVAAFARGLAEGRRGIGALRRLAYRGRSAVAAEVPEIPPLAVRLDPAEARRLSRSDRLAVVAVAEAARMAGLDDRARAEVGLAVGATTGGMLETEEAYGRWRRGDVRRPRLSGFLGMPLSTVGAAIAQSLGCFGPRTTVSTACSSGALAITAAAGMVARGEAPVAVAVGVDVLCRLTYAGFDALQALDPEPCRPFDVRRRGLSLGEGAGALVVETVAHARARGAAVRALLLGAGVTADAHHVTAPRPDAAGAIAALRGALAAALDALVAMRAREGAALARDLAGRLDGVEALVARAAALVPQTVEHHRARLAERVQELSRGLPLDPARLAQEVALFADRTDVTEEVTRLGSHLSQARALLGGGEPAGRKLDFLVQEMHREVNTIGSKSQSAEIAAIVVTAKAEVERMREQVQNVE